MSSPEAQALALKAEGNTLYKQRSFDEAAAKYEQAYELHKDITYLNNLAGELLTSLRSPPLALPSPREVPSLPCTTTRPSVRR